MKVVEKFFTKATAEQIWRLLADVEHWPDWTPTVLEAKALTGSGLVPGARYRVVQPKLRPAIYEGTESIPNRNFTCVQKFAGAAFTAEHFIRAGARETEVELAFASGGLLANIAAAIFSKTISS
jgi:hypothetical protein